MPQDSSAAAALAADLRAAVRGAVRFDAAARALYATDASNYRQVPIGVVLPRDEADVLAALEVCRRHGAPVLPRGAGTSLAGQACNVAVVLDFTRHLGAVLEIDPAARLARVQPGCVLDRLRAAAAPLGLTFGPDPATHAWCTLGGMIGNNACGVHSLVHGRTVENVEELVVVTGDGVRLKVGATGEEELGRRAALPGREGEIYRGLRALRDRVAPLVRERFPRIPRRVSGFNLDQLLPENGFHVARALVGTEGTCVTVIEAAVRLVPLRSRRCLVCLGEEEIAAAADRVPDVLTYAPSGLEGIDGRLVDSVRRQGFHAEEIAALPPGAGWLIVEFDGLTPEEAWGRAEAMIAGLSRGPRPPALRLIEDPVRQARLWKMREAAVGVTARAPGLPATSPGWEDSAVAPERLGSYLRGLADLLASHGYGYSFYGHFGEGCVHARIDFDFATAAGVARFRSFLDQAADLVVAHGGSLSGEHGDGQARAALLPRMFGEELVAAFREFKALWDPEGRMNPGKVVAPRPPDADLRLGPGTGFQQPAPHLEALESDGGLAGAALRCVGVGACRRGSGGTICPSYRVTGAEEHSTRGRAHLLAEVLRSDPGRIDGLAEEDVRAALDLCLGCKGCKGDCPARVDVAAYKAEFLSRYYARRLRPRSAWAFGLVDVWARLAAPVAGLANRALGSPAAAGLIRKAAGIAPERSLPRLAPETFRAWWHRRPRPASQEGEKSPRVLLWADTFHQHLHPAPARAAVEVLEALGWQVELPPAGLCCGRPLYDSGMLGLARRRLRRILAALRDDLRAGTPLVVLEPSCASVFRDELLQLFPDDPDARLLSTQTLFFADLLERDPAGLRARLTEGPSRPARRALVQGHCHQQALAGLSSEARVLAALGLDVEVLDAGCCGMAGGFGFTAGEPCRVSLACAEQGLLPAVRAAAPETLLVADGWSCREQIAQTTGRRALHLAEVVRAGLAPGAE